MVDITIIGAGPAGICCALAAKKKQLKTVMIDKGNIVNSIIGFPQNMTFFSTADLLELDNIPFTSISFRPNRGEAIKYYQGIVDAFNLSFILDAEISTIKKAKSGFVTEFIKNGEPQNIQSRTVIIATGFYDNPNTLNIPGENLPHVSHYYSEPYSYFGKKVVVVGGKNSAVEAALELYRFGADVTIVHRKPEIKESVKYWILPDIQNRINANQIKVLLNTELKEISNRSVLVDSKGQLKSFPADAVFLLTGYHPNMDILHKLNVNFDPHTFIPQIDVDSLRTNISGIYLAGSIIAGKNANKVFIENSREHGKKIINDIIRSLR